MKRSDLINKRFGKLLVKEFAFVKNGTTYWKCLCDCGNFSIKRRNNLQSGRTKSCGCFHKTRHIKHGMYKTPEYRVWAGMIQRCHNPNNPEYKNYGKRGIRVCERWRNSFIDFFQDIGKRPTTKHTIERIKNHQNYTPENCLWKTMKHQNRNRRDNVVITFSNKTQCLMDWSLELNIKYETLRARLRRGWSIERTLSTHP